MPTLFVKFDWQYRLYDVSHDPSVAFTLPAEIADASVVRRIAGVDYATGWDLDGGIPFVPRIVPATRSDELDNSIAQALHSFAAPGTRGPQPYKVLVSSAVPVDWNLTGVEGPANGDEFTTWFRNDKDNSAFQLSVRDFSWAQVDYPFDELLEPPPADPSEPSERPSLLLLARAAKAVYGNEPTVSGPAYTATILANSADIGFGFKASAYINPNGSQIIFAIRGTEPLSETNWFADIAFLSNQPSATFKGMFEKAAAFLATIVEQHPAANVTLTGHSLGGALSQMLGAKSGFDTVVFDAPGAGSLLPLMPAVEIPGGGNFALNANYTVAGDQASQVGLDIGSTYTLSSDIGLRNNPLYPLLGNLDVVVHDHLIDTVVRQLEAGVAPEPGKLGPNLLPPPEDIITPVAIQVQQLGELIKRTFIFDGATMPGSLLTPKFIDPAPGYLFEWLAEVGTAPVGAIALPRVEGVSSYDVQVEQGGDWAHVTALPGAELAFSAPATHFKFEAVNSADEAARIPYEFPVYARFTEGGRVSFALTSTDTLSGKPPNPLPPDDGGVASILETYRQPDGRLDWNAAAASATANYEATGQWFVSPNPHGPPLVNYVDPIESYRLLDGRIDWNAAAANVTAHYDSTGQWYLGPRATPDALQDAVLSA